VVQVAAQSATLRRELDAAQQALAEVRQGAAAAEARAARLDAKAAQQQTVWTLCSYGHMRCGQLRTRLDWQVA
jgi:septal ring factor EnvC (AmiA/AmiB activator)